VDKYIVEQKPWVLAKQEDAASQEQLQATLYNSAEVVRIVAALIYPVMPKSAAAIWKQLGVAASPADVRLADLKWGQLEAGTRIGEVEPVFPRMDVEETIAKMKELEQQAMQEQAEILGKTQPAATESVPVEAPAATPAPEPQPAEAPAEVEEKSPMISIDDFAKVDLRVGVVKSAEKVKKADRLLHLMVDIGEPELRSIVAGIAEAYDPETIVGRKIVIVANLEPRKLRGLVSQGMVVAASAEGGKPALVGFHEDTPIGARLR
jgi:methionyl-tRNA synthetase